MDVTQQIRREEGVMDSAYQDHLGYWTIGVGRLIDNRKGGRLAPDEIEYLLRNDVARFTKEVLTALPWAARLDEVRQAVLVGMAFQMGTAGLLQFKRTLAEVEAGNFATAGEMMLQSKWAKQTPERARRMSAQMWTGQWQT